MRPLRILAPLLLVALCGCGTRGGAPAGVRLTLPDPPVPLGSGQPGLTVSGERVLLSWVEKAADGPPVLRFSVLSDGGWTEPRDVVRAADLLLSYSEIPTVRALPDGSIAATWTARRAGTDGASEIRLSLSRDGGASWTAPAVPHRDASATPHGFASVAYDGAGLVVAWLDGRASQESEYGEGGTRLYAARFSGAGFEDEELVDDRVCDCCKTALASAESGLLLAYRDRSADDVRDISVALQRAGRWSAPRPLSGERWRLSACPTNGPAASAAGNVAVVAWFTGADAHPRVLASFSRDGGASFDDPVVLSSADPLGRVDAAVYPDGTAAVAWLEKRGSQAAVVARRLRSGSPPGPPVEIARTSAGRASGFPRVAVRGRDEALVAWTETDPRPRVRLAAARLPL